jgi:hypothetical protein
VIADRFDDALTEREVAVLREWAVAGASPGLADRVVGAWTDEREQSRRAMSVAAKRRRVLPWALGVASMLAAVVLVLVLRDLAIARADAREVAARMATPEREAGKALAELRTQTGAALARHCVPCHDGAHADRKPGALNVFDVRAAKWWMTMSDRQLPVLAGRMDGTDDASTDERAVVHRWVDAELSHRGG